MVAYRHTGTKPREFTADETGMNTLPGSILSRLKTCEGAALLSTIKLTTKWMLTGLRKLLVEVGAVPLVH
jgi:hypothetical protein